MRKTLLFAAVLFLLTPLCAQSGKKVQNAAGKTAEPVTERKISSLFNSGLRSFYTAQYEDAERIFSTVISANPKHAPSYYMRAKIFRIQKRYSESETALKQAVKIDKGNVWYRVALAENYMLTQNYKQALPLWESICKEFGNNEKYLFDLYECYVQLGNPGKMIETLDRIEEILGCHEDITSKKVSIWLKQGKVDAAIQEYDRLIEKDPYSSTNYLKAALLNEEYGRYDAALKYYEKAYELFPDDPEVNMMLANYWILRQDESKGSVYIEKLLPDPNVDIAKKMTFIRKQVSDMNEGNSDKVEMWVRQIASAHPANAETNELLGEVCYKKGKYKDAARYFEAYLKNDDSKVEIWTMFVKSAEKSQEYRRLIGFEEEIATIFPQSPDKLMSLASAFLSDGDADKAIEYFKQALSFSYDSDQSSAIRQGLYDAYMKKGDTESAKRYSK